MKKLKFIFFISLTISLSSCKEDITASWLKIDTINLVTNTTTEGINSNDITDVWLYMDSQPMGVWELPCEIPILAEGEHEFFIRAGIKSNGINATRIFYPFYKPTEFTLTLKKGETVSYTPSVTYKPNLNFSGREDFEDTGIILSNDDLNDTTKIHLISNTNYPDIVKYGNNCGSMSITSTDTICQVYTDLAINISKNQIFMELDYMNTNTFAIGLITQSGVTGITVNSPFIRINAQEESNLKWKKIYLDLTEYLTTISSPLNFEYYIISQTDEGVTEGKVYLDNIKIVQFN